VRDRADSYRSEVSKHSIADALHPFSKDLVTATKRSRKRSEGNLSTLCR